MFVLQQRTRPAREVNAEGMVACPIRGRSLDYETCLGCNHLEDFRASEDGDLLEIHCVPASRTVLPPK